VSSEKTLSILRPDGLQAKYPQRANLGAVSDLEQGLGRAKILGQALPDFVGDAAIGVDFIDESEVLTPADESHHIWKHDFKVPFVCGCRDLGEALRRIGEGAAMIRTKGEAGTGNIVEAVRHMRAVMDGIRQLAVTPQEELMARAKELGAPFELVEEIHRTGKLPVVNFAAGGVATPADAALMMQLGADGIFVGSGVFKSGNPSARAKAIVKATTHYQDPAIIAEVSKNLGEAMPGLDMKQIKPEELLATRGW